MAKTSLRQTEMETSDLGHRFIIFFLNNDEAQSVHVDEVSEPDFSAVTKHLDSGGSVYITHRRKPKPRTSRRKGSNKSASKRVCGSDKD